MKKLFLVPFALVVMGPVADAALAVYADFDSEPSGTVTSPTTVDGINFNGFSLDSAATVEITSGGVGGSQGLAITVADPGTYPNVGEIGIGDILSFPDLDRANAIISVTARYDRTDGGTGGYNTFRLIQNTDAAGGGNFDPIDADTVTAGLQDLALGSSNAFVTQTFNLTPYLDRLDADPGFGYASLRFVVNKNDGNAGTLVLDNIQLNTVVQAIPEPSALAALALVGGVVASRRRCR